MFAVRNLPNCLSMQAASRSFFQCARLRYLPGYLPLQWFLDTGRLRLGQRALTECRTERSLRAKNLDREDILVMLQAEARETDYE
jgi:hypothetical protein